MGDYCPACINCKKAWSVDMGLSCHEFCEEFKKWEAERKEGVLSRDQSLKQSPETSA